MIEPQTDLASRLLEIVPMVMRAAAAEIRRREPIATLAHLGILMTLTHGSCILSDLADHHIVSRPTMSNTVNTMVERGWLQRTPDAADRRKIWVSLTPAGVELVQAMQKEGRIRAGELLAFLSTEEQKALSAGLDVLQHLFDLITNQAEGAVATPTP